MSSGRRPLPWPPGAGTRGLVAVRGVCAGGVCAGVLPVHALRSGAAVLRPRVRDDDAAGDEEGAGAAAGRRPPLSDEPPRSATARRAAAPLPPAPAEESDASDSPRWG